MVSESSRCVHCYIRSLNQTALIAVVEAASGNRRAMQRLSELKKLGNKKAGTGARPTRQQAKDECVIC